MTRLAALVAGLSLVFALAGCSGNSTDTPAAGADKYAAFDKFVDDTMKKYEVPGAVVVIATADTTEFLKGYGVRSIADNKPMDTKTRFQLASVSKFFAAATVGLVVESGKVTWTEPVKTYYPGFQLKSTRLTDACSFEKLLSHQSGLLGYDGEILGRQGWSYGEIIRRVRYMDVAEGDLAKNPPEPPVAYSNMGFFLAGEFAAYMDADVKALDWVKLVNTKLLAPLGMTRSTADDSKLEADENHVAGHWKKDGTIQLMELEADTLPPAGSIISTGEDMVRWMRMLLGHGQLKGKTILKGDTIDAIFKNVVLKTGTSVTGGNTWNGLGTENYEYNTKYKTWQIVSKNGALNGVRTYLVLIPEKKIGIFVACNKNLNQFPEAVAYRFLEDQLGQGMHGTTAVDLQKLAWEAEAQWAKMADPLVPPEKTASKVPGAQKVGSYSSDLYGKFVVSDNGDGTFKMAGQDSPSKYSATLKHWDAEQYWMDWGNSDDMPGLTVFTQAAGVVTGLDGVPPSGPFVNYGTFTRTGP
jgi:CubicO group peptidase (beta-lactamase class C family)